jgi:hypothetical protein
MFRAHVRSLTIVQLLLFVKSQFTTNAQNVAWRRLIMDRPTISKSLGVCSWFGRYQKCIGELSAHSQVELTALGGLSVPTDKKLND